MNEGLLLDTHAAIWLLDATLNTDAVERVLAAGIAGQAYVSPITPWEVGLLARKPAKEKSLRLNIDPMIWYSRLLENSLLRECPFSGAIALASTLLPGDFHSDPADRFLVATARELNFVLMTRDRKILAYAAQGHVKAIAC